MYAPWLSKQLVMFYTLYFNMTFSSYVSIQTHIWYFHNNSLRTYNECIANDINNPYDIRILEAEWCVYLCSHSKYLHDTIGQNSWGSILTCITALTVILNINNDIRVNWDFYFTLSEFFVSCFIGAQCHGATLIDNTLINRY